MSGPEVGTAPGCSLPCPGHPGGWGHFQSLQGQVSFLPPAPCMLRGSHSVAFRRHNPQAACPRPRAWGALTHCASGLASGRASYVCSVCRRVWEPVCLRLFGCTPVPQAARPLARMPGWARLSRAAQEADRGRCPVCRIGPAPTCLGSGQGVCREPRGTLAGCYWGAPCRVGSALLGGTLQGGLGAVAGWGQPADPAEDVPQSSRLLGEPSCPAQADALSLRVLLPWDRPLASWAQQLRGPLRAEPLGAPGRPWAWNISAAPRAADMWIAFLFKPTFAVCVSFSPLPALFI